MNDIDAPAVFLIDENGSLISSTAGAAVSWEHVESATRGVLRDVRGASESRSIACGAYVLYVAPIDPGRFAVIAVARCHEDPIVRLARRCALTQRECAVVRALAEGKTTAEIGNHLSIAPSTVVMHIKRILAKTGTPTRAAILGRVLDEAMAATASRV